MKKTNTTMKKTTLAIALASLLSMSMASAVLVQITVTNIGPAGGVALAPVWVGVHDGTFDTFDADAGQTASPGLELLAELGDPSTLRTEFAAAAPTGVDGNTMGALPSGATLSMVLDLSIGGVNDYLSYASMLLPTNDYFIGNGNPMAINIASVLAGGGSLSIDIGGTIYDAGTEAEDFEFSAPPNTAPLFPFLAGVPTNPPGGGDQGGTITSVLSADPFSAFANIPMGGVPASLNFNDGALYPNGIARITVTLIPEPSTALLLALMTGFVGLKRRRRRV